MWPGHVVVAGASDLHCPSGNPAVVTPAWGREKCINYFVKAQKIIILNKKAEGMNIFNNKHNAHYLSYYSIIHNKIIIITNIIKMHSNCSGFDTKIPTTGQTLSQTENNRSVKKGDINNWVILHSSSALLWAPKCRAAASLAWAALRKCWVSCLRFLPLQLLLCLAAEYTWAETSPSLLPVHWRHFEILCWEITVWNAEIKG